MADDEKLPFEGLLGSAPDDRQSNMMRGLLGMFIGSQQGYTLGEALASGLGHGLNYIDAGRASQAQRDFRRFQMAKPESINPYEQQVRYNARTGQFENFGTPMAKPYSARDLVQVTGPDGRPTYAPASSAVGQPAYTRPQPPLNASNFMSVVGDDGLPRIVPAGQAAGQTPYFKPDGLTPVQVAGVDAIKNARVIMEQHEAAARRQGLSLRDYINRATQTVDPITKLPVYDYNSDLWRNARLAMKPIPGSDDPDARKWSQTISGAPMPSKRKAEDSSMRELPKTTPGATSDAGGEAKSPKQLMVGQVVRGWKYKGGDPSSPSSWEQVKGAR